MGKMGAIFIKATLFVVKIVAIFNFTVCNLRVKTACSINKPFQFKLIFFE